MQEAAVMPGWDGWHELAAVKDKRVFVLDGNALLNRSGPRVVDTIEVLARLFHPHDVVAPAGDRSRGRVWDQLGRGI